VVDPGVPGAATTTTAVVPVTFLMPNGLEVTTAAPVTATIVSPVFPQSGVAPPGGSPVFADYNSVDPFYQYGFEGHLEYRYGRDAVEFAGFYIPEVGPARLTAQSVNVSPAPTVTVTAITKVTPPAGFFGSTVVTDNATLENEVAAARTPAGANRLDLPFFNPPAGFGGANGTNLWLQANRVAVLYRNSLANAEANYRYYAGDQVQVLCGIRFLDQRETAGILTDDNGPMPVSNLANIASYETRTDNRLLLGQVGAQFDLPVCPWLCLGGFVKGGWGADDLRADVTLTRGDGLVGFSGHRSRVQFSQLYEGGLFFDFFLFERVKFHGGYNVLWLVDVAEAFDQVDYDLSHTLGSQKNHGTAFYHGPVLEFEFVF
jgi:hypothetical protein